ncbi:MAG TPA: aldehyde dehydrogenase family protein [Thermoplasmata archaeon]|nr:aldehyde dehydrogenase family protein [Thermoplasmata archaeon]
MVGLLETLSPLFDTIQERRDGIPSFKLFIHGLWLDASGGGTFDVDSPIDDAVVARVPDSSPVDVEAAIDAAVQGRRSIQSIPGVARVEILQRARSLLLQHRKDFERVLTAEAGKPPKDTEGEVNATADRLELTREESREIFGEFIPGEWTKDAKGRAAIVARVPLGVVAAICPFNYPLFIAAAKAIPALLAGNAVVLKPASDTPLSMLLFARILEEAGIPAGAFNVVTGRGAPVGAALASSPKVAMVSFTGSTEVGEAIVRDAGIKKLHLELGGKGMAIVLDDADLALAAEKCLEGSLKNAGQRCDAISAVLVVDAVADSFVGILEKEMASWKHGDPREAGMRVGPLINPAAARRVQGLIDDAVANGAKLIRGGTSRGCYVEPTLLDHVPIVARIAREETFGPVVTVMRIKDEEEALEVSKMSRYGLDSCVFTNDYRRVWRIARDLQVGGLTVNDHPRHGVGYFPFGGSKASGIGREGIGYSVDEMTELKTIVFNLEP